MPQRRINLTMPVGKEPTIGKLGFGSTERRFKDQAKNCTPAPGTYHREHNIIPKSFGTKGMMDSRSSRMGAHDNVGCHLAPNLYDIKRPIGEMPKKEESQKGPCKRILRTIPKRKPSEPYIYEEISKLGDKHYIPPTFIEELNKKKTYGQFNQLSRFPVIPTGRLYFTSVAHCPRPADSPGPGSYNIAPSIITPVMPSPAPFLSTAKRRFQKKY